jgi:hypothetical protein
MPYEQLAIIWQAAKYFEPLPSKSMIRFVALVALFQQRVNQQRQMPSAKRQLRFS